MKSFFKNLFDYNHQCNFKLAQAYHENHDRVSDVSVKLFSHILNAHEIWNARIQGRENRYGVWDLLNPSDFESINETNLENSYSIIRRSSAAPQRQGTEKKRCAVSRHQSFYLSSWPDSYGFQEKCYRANCYGLFSLCEVEWNRF